MTSRSELTDRDRAERLHRYRDPRTGLQLVSVSRVAKSYDDGDRLGAGAAAAAKLVRAGVDYRKKWTEAAERGRRVHGYAEDWAAGRTTDVRDDDAPYLEAFEGFVRDKRPQWLEAERSVVSAVGYGGRFDLVGLFDDSFWLLDLKTGKQYPTELALQLAGYACADGMVVWDEAGNAAGLEPMPHIERWAGLYLSEEGRWTLLEVPSAPAGTDRPTAQRAAFQCFCSLLSVRLWAGSQGG